MVPVHDAEGAGQGGEGSEGVMVPAITLSEGQQRAYDVALSGKSMFITGPGGTGKSEVLSTIIKGLGNVGRSVAVCASTGIAAIRVGGSTIHSWLGTGLHQNSGELSKAIARGDVFRNIRKVEERLKGADVLVIDEVSMLSGDYISMMDFWLKRYRKSSMKPFGHVQMIFTGDFLQLPPVSKRGEEADYPYAFQSPAWQKLAMENVALTHVFRQDDREFIEHLMRVRRGYLPLDTQKYFNARVGVKLKDPTRLYAHNATAYSVNFQFLHKLAGKKYEFEADVEADDDMWGEKIVKDCIADFSLELKVGAPVLFLRNNYALKYVNGERGTITEVCPPVITVQKLDGTVVHVVKETWEAKDADQKVRATMAQYPLKLAWAMTIHKSQGMTLDLLECNVSECFAPGQTYVALSRVKTAGGLALTENIEPEHVKTDSVLVEYCQKLGI